jgi:hypothetical protein
MKIELRHTDEIAHPIDRPCEVCEQERPGIGAVAVVKQVHAEDPHVDFIVCDVCAAKIAILITRRHMMLDQRAPPLPPPPSSNGGGGP